MTRFPLVAQRVGLHKTALAFAMALGLGAALLGPAAPARADHEPEHVPDAVLQLLIQKVHVLDYGDWRGVPFDWGFVIQKCGTGCDTSEAITVPIDDDHEDVITVDRRGSRLVVYPGDELQVQGRLIELTGDNFWIGTWNQEFTQADNWGAGRARQETFEFTHSRGRNETSVEYNVLRVEPDLAVEAVWMSPSQLQDGQEAQVCARFKNVGRGPAGDIPFALEIDGVPAFGYVDWLGKDETADRCSGAMALPFGSHTALARIDAFYPYAVPDPNKANNIASTTFAVTGGPDLVAENLRFPDVQRVGLASGHPYRICADIRNLGTSLAGPSRLDFVGGIATASADLPMVQPGQSHEGCAEITMAELPSNTLAQVSAAADAGRAVRESAEDNNEAYMYVSVMPILEIERPNISIALLDVQPSDQLVGGEPSEMCVTTAVGYTGVGPFTMQLRVDDVLRGEQRSLGQNGSTSATHCFTLTQPGGSHEVQAILDTNNDVEESNEGDNTLARSFAWLNPPTPPADLPVPPPAPYPDLLVASLEIEDSSCDPGRNRIVALVRNNGSAPAGQFIVRLLIDGQERDNETIEDLEIGGDQRVRFSRIELDAGQREVRVLADAGQNVDESDETNNERLLSANCAAAQPDLLVSSVEVEDNDCDPGRNRINAEVRNIGPGRAQQFIVRLWVDGREVSNEDVDDLDSGDDKHVRFSRIELAAGSHELRVKADAGNALTEDNEANNERTATVNCAEESRR